MPKPEGVGAVRRKQGRRPAALVDAVEGYVAELCRDLDLQVKRMHQLQEQANELRAVIRTWVSRSEMTPDRKRAKSSRAGRR